MNQIASQATYTMCQNSKQRLNKKTTSFSCQHRSVLWWELRYQSYNESCSDDNPTKFTSVRSGLNLEY